MIVEKGRQVVGRAMLISLPSELNPTTTVQGPCDPAGVYQAAHVLNQHHLSNCVLIISPCRGKDYGPRRTAVMPSSGMCLAAVP